MPSAETTRVSPTYLLRAAILTYFPVHAILIADAILYFLLLDCAACANLALTYCTDTPSPFFGRSAVVEKSAREELEALLSKKADSGDDDQLQQQHLPTFISYPPNNDNNAQGQAALDEVLFIFRRLLASIDEDDKEKIRHEKIQQTEKARYLLRNMTKGTQSKSMFRDISALRGYARQKFYGRASLIIESLGKLSPNALEAAASSFHNHLDDQQRQEQKLQMDIMNMCWERLGSIEKMCSLGCGPGNDAVGLSAFLRHTFKGEVPDREVAMLDYAIDEWNDAVLDGLIPILVPDYVSRISCHCCDITKQITDDKTEHFVENSDIFLVSYLLTEARNLWDRFFVQLVSLAKAGALFYFAEPVPWQLHRLIRMSMPDSLSQANSGIDCSPLYRLRFVWVDSSMHLPDMQKLDRRSGGPAVLLAIKV